MKRSTTQLMLILIGIMLSVTACGAGAKASESIDPESVGDPELGAAIFATSYTEAPSCSFCHTISDDDSGIGPSLYGIGNRAGNRVDGMNAVVYLRESIVDPNAYIADGSSKSRMYAHFDELLSDEDIDNLIAYLLILK